MVMCYLVEMRARKGLAEGDVAIHWRKLDYKGGVYSVVELY